MLMFNFVFKTRMNDIQYLTGKNETYKCELTCAVLFFFKPPIALKIRFFGISYIFSSFE